jgi:hypothetical protein
MFPSEEKKNTPNKTPPRPHRMMVDTTPKTCAPHYFLRSEHFHDDNDDAKHL